MVLVDVCLPHSKQDDDAAAESTAIVAISRALSALPDRETRLRVLRWANERFNTPAAVAAHVLAPAAVVAADSMLALDALHALFEPAPVLDEANDTPHHIAREEMSDLFDEPVVRGRPELRVVARKEESPAPVAGADLRDLYEEPVAQHLAELDAVVDFHEPLAAHRTEPDESIGDLFDGPVMQYYTAVDEPVADLYEEPVAVLCEDTDAEPRPDAQAPASEDQSLDALVADFASALRTLTLQFQDASA